MSCGTRSGISEKYCIFFVPIGIPRLVDGIDSIDETVARSCSKLDLTSVLIQTSNDLLEKYTNAVKIERFTGDNILMEL